MLRSITRLSQVGRETYSKIRHLSHVPVDDALFGLDDEEKELRQTARKFFETELGDLAYQIDKDDHFPDFADYMKRYFIVELFLINPD